MKRNFSQGVNWTLLYQVTFMAINYVSLILLARFLKPADFGLVALSTVLTGLFEMINGFGIPQLVIKNQISDNRQLGALMFSSIILSIGLAAVLVSIGWLYVRWYEDSVHGPLFKIITVSSVGLMFSGFSSLYNSFYQRDLNFVTPTIYSIFAVVISNFMAVSYAIMGGGYWALVIKNLAPSGLLSLGYILFSHYKPILNLNFNLLKEEKQFTFWLSGNQLINYMSRNLDYFIIGKFFNVSVVGQYSIAYKLMLFPMKLLSSRVQMVLYPTLARMKDNKTVMINFYVKVVSYISFVSLPLMGLASIAAPFWVSLLFDTSEYTILITLVQLLSLAGAFQAVTSPIGSLFLVNNMVRLMAVYSTFSALIFALGYFLGALSGSIYTFVIIYLMLSIGLNFFIANYIPLNKLKHPYSSFLKSTLKPLLPSVAGYICVYQLSRVFEFRLLSHGLMALIVIAIVFGLTYFGTYVIFYRDDLQIKVAELKKIYS